MKKRAEKIRRVGLVANADKTAGGAFVAAAARRIAAAGGTVFTDAPTAKLAGLSAKILGDSASFARAVDLLMVFVIGRAHV